MKKIILLYALVLSVFLVSCVGGMTDDTGNRDENNSDPSGGSMPGINDILPSESGATETPAPEGTTPAGSPDSSIGTGNIRGLGDTVEAVMERIEQIISDTQTYLKDQNEAKVNASERLTLAQARCIALADAHFADDEVRFEKEDLVTRDGREYFSFIFNGGGIRYYYDIDAYTAQIIGKNTEDNS